MGDISEMLLDGSHCEVCMQFFGDACGYPRRCQGCGGSVVDFPGKVACPVCGKRVKPAGLMMHQIDVHNWKGGA